MEREAGRRAFGGAADAYHEARPRYPDGVYVDALRGLAPEGVALLDVGAGNGLAAQGFIDRGVGDVTFIEPDERFHPLLTSRAPQAVVEGSTLETSRLSGRRFDLVVVGTAWHWFDPARRMNDIAERLRPGGRVVLVWNLFRDDTRRDEFHEATQRVFDAIPGQRAASDRPLGALDRLARVEEFLETGRFVSVSIDVRRWKIELDPTGVRSLYAGFSTIQRLPSEQRSKVLDQLVDIAEREFGGVVERGMTTPSYIASARP